MTIKTHRPILAFKSGVKYLACSAMGSSSRHCSCSELGPGTGGRWPSRRIVGIIAIIGIVKTNWETIWAGVANFFIDQMNTVIDGINAVTGVFSKIPGVADLELGRFERIVVEAAETTDELTQAAETVPPQIVAIGSAASDAAPAVDQLATKAERLAEAAEKSSGAKIEAWHAKQEILGLELMDVNEAIVSGTLPTLDDLIAKLESEVVPAIEKTFRRHGSITARREWKF